MKLPENENHYPILHYFEYDFLHMYERTWTSIENSWETLNVDPEHSFGCIHYENMKSINLVDAACAQFYLLYSNDRFNPTSTLDFFYAHQEENGAIRANYDIQTFKPILKKDNPEGISCPIILWAEYNHFNKTDNKKRLKEIIPKLDNYLNWLISLTKKPNGLFHAPLSATFLPGPARKNTYYPIDFNVFMAAAFNFMSKLTNFTNHRNLVIKYTKMFYQLKSLINNHFWDNSDKIYYDLDEHMNHIKVKTILSFFPLLANIPKSDKYNSLMRYLKSPEHFQTDHPFPCISLSDSHFSSSGQIYKGSVHFLLNFILIKGLEQYESHEFLRECIIKHLYGVLSVFESEDKELSDTFWEAYHAKKELPAKSTKAITVRPNFTIHAALATIVLMIENIIGIEINLPKKMLHWVIPNLEELGIEYIQLKKNYISTLLVKNKRGWEIRHSSEKLYYFSVDVLEMSKKKTLPFPSGKCSLLLEKL